MFNKEQVQEAIARIDNTLAQLNANREGHLILVNDVKLVQAVCMEYFEGKEDERANEPTEHTEPGDKDK